MKKISNHTNPLKLDLQFFAEEDAILPDDFEQGFDSIDQPIVEPVEEPVEPQTEEITEENMTQEDIEQTEGMTESEKQAFLKIKYNKEEIELDEEKARELAQKGMNYDKVQEQLNQLQNDPRLAFVEAQAQKNNMTVDQYLQEVQRWEQQQQIEALVQQNIPEEYAKEMLENRQFREKYEAERKAKEQQEQQQKEQLDFLDYFKQVNGRNFDADKDIIPNEVWQAVDNGTPLKYAYQEHHIKELQNQIKTLKTNKENEKKAPVQSVTAHGGDSPVSEDPFLKGFDSI